MLKNKYNLYYSLNKCQFLIIKIKTSKIFYITLKILLFSLKKFIRFLAFIHKNQIKKILITKQEDIVEALETLKNYKIFTKINIMKIFKTDLTLPVSLICFNNKKNDIKNFQSYTFKKFYLIFAFVNKFINSSVNIYQMFFCNFSFKSILLICVLIQIITYYDKKRIKKI